MEDIASQLSNVVQSWSTLGTLAGLIAVVHLLTSLTKLEVFSKWVKASYRPWIAMGLGMLGGFLASLTEGKPMIQAALSGLFVGLGAIGANEGIILFKPSEQAKKQAAASVAKAMEGGEAEVKAKVELLKAQLDTAMAHPDKKARLKALAVMAKNGASTVTPVPPPLPDPGP